MARITVEDCLEKIPSRFALVIAASQRSKELIKSGNLTINSSKGNKEIVNALREIAAGTVEVIKKSETIAPKTSEIETTNIQEEDSKNA